MKLKTKFIASLTPILLLLLFITPVLADITRTVTIFTSETYSGTGWNTKTYTVDVSAISNAKQIVIHVSGSTQTDEYMRFLLIKIDGQIVNGHQFTEQKPWAGYTALVAQNFDLRYDVTSIVKGKNRVTVEIGLTTFVGSWILNAEFNAVIEESTIIPAPTPSQNPITIKNTMLAAGIGVACIIAALYIRGRELE